MGISTQMNGKEIDRVLKAISDVQSDSNDGLILYIRRGEIALDTKENLFTVMQLEE